jgi:hypothetical protein
MEKIVFKIQKITLSIMACGVLFAVGSFVESAVAQKQDTPIKQDKLALSDSDVKQLLLIMDVDKSGKVSKKEFLEFMAAEFDRLDADKSGELDVKELSQSGLRLKARPNVGK